MDQGGERYGQQTQVGPTETRNHSRSSLGCTEHQPGVQEARSSSVPVLPVGEEVQGCWSGGLEERRGQKRCRKSGRAGGGSETAERPHHGDRAGKLQAKKGAVALEPKRHKNKVQRLQILETVATAHRHTGTPVRSILKELGLPRASYYRYLKAAEPKKRKPRIKAPPLTPPERCIIRDVALAHPTTGYKRLTWTMQNEELAGVRAYQVLGMLREEELIHRRGAA